jgi:hypothetical protein
MNLTELKLEGKGLEELINEVEIAFMDIPMGNTKFQIDNFVMNASITPERKFRTVGLEMRTKLQEINRMKFNLTKLKIDIEEIEFNVEKEENPFQKRRLLVDIDMKKSELFSYQKTIKDAVDELKIYYSYFKELPKPSKEEFEIAEETYFALHLHNQVLGVQGAILSLRQMGLDVNDKGQLLDMRKSIGSDK